jgi:hypothetical protein
MVIGPIGCCAAPADADGVPTANPMSYPRVWCLLPGLTVAPGKHLGRSSGHPSPPAQHTLLAAGEQLTPLCLTSLVHVIAGLSNLMMLVWWGSTEWTPFWWDSTHLMMLV